MIDIPILVAYADDHKLYRKGAISFLQESGRMLVDIEAANGEELIAAIRKAKVKPDVCIVDINMPKMDGFDTVVEIKKRWPEIKILVHTVFNIELYIIRMILNGANGYIIKGDADELVNAVTIVYNEEMYYNSIVTRRFVQDIKSGKVKLPQLNGREMQVLKFCSAGLSYEQMGEKMKATPKSVEGYRRSLFNKLNVHNRSDLVLIAVQLGIIPLEINTSGKQEILTAKK